MLDIVELKAKVVGNDMWLDLLSIRWESISASHNLTKKLFFSENEKM